jgi:uncharacterized protein
MDWIVYLVAALFVLFGGLCVLAVAVSLPGTWIMLAAAVVIELVDDLWLSSPEGESAVTFGWRIIGVCAALAVVGEVIEFFAGAAGTKAGGGTRRGMIGAIVGGFVGAIVFTPIIPIPLIGTLIGALIGTFAGAVVAEVTAREAMTVGGSMRPATGALIGRVLGTVGKMAIAVVMWLVLGVSAFI